MHKLVLKNDQLRKGLEHYLEALKDKKKIQDRAEFIELHRTREGNESLLHRYNYRTYIQAANRFNLPEDIEIKTILKIKENHRRKEPLGMFTKTISSNTLSPERNNQIKLLQEKVSDKWTQKAMEAAIVGEEGACQFALIYNLPLERISEKDPYSAFDNKIGDVYTDSKTIVSIGQRRDMSFLSSRWDKNEVVILTTAKTKDYESSDYMIQIVGVLDPELLERNGFSHLIKELTWITEPFFCDIYFYYKLRDKEVTETLNLRAFKYHLAHKRFDSLRGYFGEENYLQGLLDSEQFSFMNDLLLRLIRLHQNGDAILSPLAIFEWLLRKIQEKDYNFQENLFKEILLDQISLTSPQKRYLDTILEVLRTIPDLKCKFSGKSLSEGEIVFRSGILKVYIDGYENILFAYSRYSGDILTIVKNRVCDSPACACLIHDVRGLPYGKSTCPRYGIERDIQNRKEFLS